MPLPESESSGTSDHVLGSVVKVHAISNPPDHDQPWRTKGPTGATGSGAILETSAGLRVLTNAHVVEHPVFIEVRRYGQARKHVARVVHIGHSCDLALLEIDDAAFFEGAVPIELGELPRLSERVSVCGFPIGGEHLSITEGVVSRIELTDYAQSHRQLLAVQIDAAINSGSSGGPVVTDGRMVGVAFQALEEAQSIGYMISLPVVRHFLRDVEAGRKDAFPDLGVVTQSLQSRAQRACLGLVDHDHGILVTRVVYGGSAWQTLKKGDVILAIGGTQVASDGTVPFRNGERIDSSYLVSQLHVDDMIELSVWRAGVEITCQVKLRAPQDLISRAIEDEPPTYYVHCGLLFVSLSLDYLRSWGDDWQTTAPHALLAIYESGMRTRSRLEVVILQKVMPDEANLGYHDLENAIIARVDRKRVRSLRELIRIIESGTGPYVRVETESGVEIVLDRAQALARHASILERFGIQSDRSPDLR